MVELVRVRVRGRVRVRVELLRWSSWKASSGRLAPYSLTTLLPHYLTTLLPYYLTTLLPLLLPSTLTTTLVLPRLRGEQGQVRQQPGLRVRVAQRGGERR